jgi:hypothetical protein
MNCTLYAIHKFFFAISGIELANWISGLVLVEIDYTALKSYHLKVYEELILAPVG